MHKHKRVQKCTLSELVLCHYVYLFVLWKIDFDHIIACAEFAHDFDFELCEHPVSNRSNSSEKPKGGSNSKTTTTIASTVRLKSANVVPSALRITIMPLISLIYDFASLLYDLINCFIVGYLVHNFHLHDRILFCLLNILYAR